MGKKRYILAAAAVILLLAVLRLIDRRDFVKSADDGTDETGSVYASVLTQPSGFSIVLDGCVSSLPVWLKTPARSEFARES